MKKAVFSKLTTNKGGKKQMKFYTESNEEDKQVKVEIQDDDDDDVDIYFICGNEKIRIGVFCDGSLAMMGLNKSEIETLQNYGVEIEDDEVRVY